MSADVQADAGVNTAGHADLAIARTIAEFYAAFDNRNSRQPSTAQLRRMFVAGARIMRVGSDAIEVFEVDEFIAPRHTLLTGGGLTEFHEWEVSGATCSIGIIASHSSVYEKSGLLHGQPYQGRGRKLIHLVSLGGAWLITSILWADEV